MATFLEGTLDMNEAWHCQSMACDHCQSMACDYFMSWNLNEMGSDNLKIQYLNGLKGLWLVCHKSPLKRVFTVFPARVVKSCKTRLILSVRKIQ